jgi:hypothetical protein
MAGDEGVIGLHRIELLAHVGNPVGQPRPQGRGHDEADHEPSSPAAPRLPRWLGPTRVVQDPGPSQVRHDPGVEGVASFRMAVAVDGRSRLSGVFGRFHTRSPGASWIGGPPACGVRCNPCSKDGSRRYWVVREAIPEACDYRKGRIISRIGDASTRRTTQRVPPRVRPAHEPPLSRLIRKGVFANRVSIRPDRPISIGRNLTSTWRERALCPA